MKFQKNLLIVISESEHPLRIGIWEQKTNPPRIENLERIHPPTPKLRGGILRGQDKSLAFPITCIVLGLLLDIHSIGAPVSGVSDLKSPDTGALLLRTSQRSPSQGCSGFSLPSPRLTKTL